MMKNSEINIEVVLDENKIPQSIAWKASESSADEKQHAKAVFLAFWDGVEKSAMRIDLWTKDMMVDEMADFYYQVFVTMADTFKRATGYDGLTADIKTFANTFHKKFVDEENKKNL